MQFVKENKWLVVWSGVYLLLAAFLIWNDKEYLTLFPIGLIALFFSLFYTETTFLAIAFLTPLSVNIEEYTNSFGLFVPTEPLLFGMMLLLLMQHLLKYSIHREVWKSPIIWAVGFYVFWILITSITSSNPTASFKFLLARLWFIVPILIFGPIIFLKTENIKRFLWLFSIGMIFVVIYTVFEHAQYRFGEKESHWVMWPFFKDHTIYGAIVALVTPLIFGLYFSKKHTAIVQAILFGMMAIILLGLYFSYTRAAWLSVLASLVVLAFIKFKISFKLIASVTAFAGIVLFFSWTSIQHTLERNKQEHTTEEFGERLQSATNVSTDASNLERINRWTCAVDMFQERPIVGFGPGTYAFEYARFQRPENLTIISTNFGDLGNAHSEFLGPLAEMGFMGLIAMVLIVTAIFYKAITLYIKWPAEDKEMKTIILTIIISLTTYFVHAFLNNFLDTDKAAVPIWGMCAMIIALEIKLKTQDRSFVAKRLDEFKRNKSLSSAILCLKVRNERS